MPQRVRMFLEGLARQPGPDPLTASQEQGFRLVPALPMCSVTLGFADSALRSIPPGPGPFSGIRYQDVISLAVRVSPFDASPPWRSPHKEAFGVRSRDMPWAPRGGHTAALTESTLWALFELRSHRYVQRLVTHSEMPFTSTRRIARYRPDWVIWSIGCFVHRVLWCR